MFLLLFSFYPVSIQFICPITGDMHFDGGIKMRPHKLPHCREMIFFFIINIYFEGKNFEFVKIAHSLSKLLFIYSQIATALATESPSI